MTAFALDRPGAFTPDELPEPAAGPGEVIVDVAYAAPGPDGVSAHRDALPVPPVLGVAGHVRALGEGVTGLARGEAVAALVTAPSALGRFVGSVCLSAALVVPLDTPYGAMPLDQAAAGIVSGPTAILALMDLGRLRPRDAVVVHGAASAVGRMSAGLARYMGARPLIGVVDGAAERATAASLEYTHVLVASEDVPSQVRALTGGLGAQVIVDPVGGPLRRASLAALRPLGRLVVVGQVSAEPEAPISGRDLWLGNHAALGLNLSALAASEPRRFRRAARAVFSLVARGVVTVDVTDVRPHPHAADAADGYRRPERPGVRA